MVIRHRLTLGARTMARRLASRASETSTAWRSSIEARRAVRQLPKTGLPVVNLLPIVYPSLNSEELEEVRRSLPEGLDRLNGFEDLRRVLTRLDRQFYPSPVTVRLPTEHVLWHEEGGLRLALDPQDPSISAAIAAGNYEPHVTAIVRGYCQPGWRAIDIGANIGYYAALLSERVGPTGSVIAIEANPENCRLIDLTLRKNAINNLTIVPCAVGSETGWTYFTPHVGTNGGLLSEASPERLLGLASIVPMTRLDDLAADAETVHFVKIDVEGAEGQVIGGGQRFFSHHRPLVVTEFSCEMLQRVSQIEPREYLCFFESLSYGISIIDKEHPGELIPMESADHLLSEWDDQFRIEDLLLRPA